MPTLGDEFKEYDKGLLRQTGVDVVVGFAEFKFPEFSQRYMKDFPKESDGSVIIKPNDFILAQTYERIHLPRESNLAARVEGRSSSARLGLVVHLSAPTIHAGFPGKITLEIINHGPTKIRLFPQKDRICQLIFEQVLSTPTLENTSQFFGQSSVTGTK